MNERAAFQAQVNLPEELRDFTKSITEGQTSTRSSRGAFVGQPSHPVSTQRLPPEEQPTLRVMPSNGDRYYFAQKYRNGHTDRTGTDRKSAMLGHAGLY